ncbi:MarR family transcriptional regulator [Thioclava sp. BHET1]|uniref:MarR family transcriptional regulator n=1 Tax=Thioclava dalianensis TaxID=1185766 RepID=A0A074TB56_9RHOB|nr:MarR family transcriptional regulator [Thioclava dalianensis]KEP69016.1 MarR family transcriptional regulator [Thioclava dalianensis]TMV94849.1 MarR family transcriptional regulator [Thioclava sp. BHET1]
MERVDTSLIALRRILRATEMFGRDLAKSAGLTPVQFRVLQVVSEDGWSTPKAIATRMSVSQATMTALLDKLERKNMVTRKRSERDRRQTDIVITPVGRAAIDDAPDALQQIFVRRFEALEDWEQAQLIASLERVAAMLDAHEIDASPVLDWGDISGRPS